MNKSLKNARDDPNIRRLRGIARQPAQLCHVRQQHHLPRRRIEGNVLHRPPLVFTPENARMLLDGLERALARV